MTEAAADDLAHVYWIGGGTGAGKTTVARRLAASYGLRLYDTDAVMAEHALRTTPADSPQLHAFIAMDMDQRWLRRSPEVMYETFHWYRGEGFRHIVDDLRAVPGPVVAEGFRLLPELVRPLLANPRRAVWLLPTDRFRRAALERRGSLWKIAGRTSDPEKALRNLLERDRLFTDRLRTATPCIEVDLPMSEDELTHRVATLFGIA